MKKYETVKKNDDFNDIIKNGKYLKTKYFNIYYKDGENDYPMFGLAVSKKCGNAVERNKIKRQLRMMIHNNKKIFKNKTNYIIMVKRDFYKYNYQEVEAALIEVMERI